MKKTFNLIHDKIAKPRLVESAKHDVKKYLKRERNKALPKGFDVWEFDCKFGASQAKAANVEVQDINANINEFEALGADEFYIEIIARAANKADRQIKFSS